MGTQKFCLYNRFLAALAGPVGPAQNIFTMNIFTLYMSPKCEMVARGREAGNSSLEMERRGRVTPSLEPRYWPRLAGPRLELT
jgi:hypothetical protein